MGSYYLERNVVPAFKKEGDGAVSIVIVADDFQSFVAMHDKEKSTQGQQRFALAGGTKEAADPTALSTALREAMEEMGHQFAQNDLVQLPYFVMFENGKIKNFFVAMLPAGTKLRKTGTRQVIPRNGVDVEMEVLGPPEWVPLVGALRLPPRGIDPENRNYLHYSHVRGVVEALLYLKTLGLDQKLPAFARMWSELGSRITDLQATLAAKDRK